MILQNTKENRCAHAKAIKIENSLFWGRDLIYSIISWYIFYSYVEVLKYEIKSSFLYYFVVRCTVNSLFLQTKVVLKIIILKLIEGNKKLGMLSRLFGKMRILYIHCGSVWMWHKHELMKTTMSQSFGEVINKSFVWIILILFVNIKPNKCNKTNPKLNIMHCTSNVFENKIIVTN